MTTWAGKFGRGTLVVSMALRFHKATRTRDEALMSRAKVFADVNIHKPQSYWDYENMQLQWG